MGREVSDHKISYDNLGRVLACIKVARGNGWKFRVSYFECVYTAIFPEDEERLRAQPGHSLHQTIGGRLYDYWTHANGKQGPRISRLAGAPDPLYLIDDGREVEADLVGKVP